MTDDLSGVIPPMVTPLNTQEKLDMDNAKKIVNHLINGGVDGIFLLGSSGEFTALTREVKRELLDTVIDAVEGEVPILAGVTEAGTKKTEEMLHIAVDSGVNYAVVTPPYYFPLDQKGILEHYRYLAKHSEIPIILYNIPATTGVNIERETIKKLAQEGSVQAVKDSTGDFIHFQQLINGLQDTECSVFQGHEALAATSLIVGADGIVPAYANVLPSLYTDLFGTIEAGEYNEGLTLQEVVHRLIATYEFGSVYGSIKAALSMKNLCEESVTRPLQKPTKGQKEKISKILREVESKV